MGWKAPRYLAKTGCKQAFIYQPSRLHPIAVFVYNQLVNDGGLALASATQRKFFVKSSRYQPTRDQPRFCTHETWSIPLAVLTTSRVSL